MGIGVDFEEHSPSPSPNRIVGTAQTAARAREHLQRYQEERAKALDVLAGGTGALRNWLVLVCGPDAAAHHSTRLLLVVQTMGFSRGQSLAILRRMLVVLEGPDAEVGNRRLASLDVGWLLDGRTRWSRFFALLEALADPDLRTQTGEVWTFSPFDFEPPAVGGAAVEPTESVSLEQRGWRRSWDRTDLVYRADLGEVDPRSTDFFYAPETVGMLTWDANRAAPSRSRQLVTPVLPKHARLSLWGRLLAHGDEFLQVAGAVHAYRHVSLGQLQRLLPSSVPRSHLVRIIDLMWEVGLVTRSGWPHSQLGVVYVGAHKFTEDPDLRMLTRAERVAVTGGQPWRGAASGSRRHDLLALEILLRYTEIAGPAAVFGQSFAQHQAMRIDRALGTTRPLPGAGVADGLIVPWRTGPVAIEITATMSGVRRHLEQYVALLRADGHARDGGRQGSPAVIFVVCPRPSQPATAMTPWAEEDALMAEVKREIVRLEKDALTANLLAYVGVVRWSTWFPRSAVEVDPWAFSELRATTRRAGQWVDVAFAPRVAAPVSFDIELRALRAECNAGLLGATPHLLRGDPTSPWTAGTYLSLNYIDALPHLHARNTSRRRMARRPELPQPAARPAVPSRMRFPDCGP